MVHKSQVAVVVDSSSCLPRDLLERWRIHVVSHELIIGDMSFKDGVDIQPSDFYQLIQDNHSVPTTSSPNPSCFLEVFRSASQVAESVICITVSGNFSATYGSACTAAAMAESELSGFSVGVVDSQAAAGAQGLVALQAARSADDGADLEEVTSLVEGLIPKMNLVAFLDSLYYLRRSGRVPRLAAWAGDILGIKPLTEMNLGEPKLLAKPRTRSGATNRMLGVMRERIQDMPVHVNVMHAHAASDAQDLRQRVEDEFDCRELFVSEFTPVMGSHLGPGLLGLAFYAEA